MNDDLDPHADVLKALRQLEHLEPTLGDIERAHREIAARIAALHVQLGRYRTALAELDSALGRAREHPGLLGRAEPASVSIDDDDLRSAVRDHPSGLAPRELRRVLDIGAAVSTTQFSRILSFALERGVVYRTGKGPGVRYHPATSTPSDDRRDS